MAVGLLVAEWENWVGHFLFSSLSLSSMDYDKNYASASAIIFQTFLLLPLAISIKLFNGDPPELSAIGFD